MSAGQAAAPGDRTPRRTTDERYDLRRARTARAARRVALGLLVVFLLAGAVGLFGTTPRSRTGRYGTTTVTVTYPAVSRGGLAVHYQIEVQRPGGFAGPVRLGVTERYLDAFDENGVSPEPSSETVDGALLVWEFDPPAGDTLTVSLDARVEPDTRWRRRGHAVLYDGERPVLDLGYTSYFAP